MEQGQGSNGAPWILIHYLLVEIDGLRKLFVRFFRIVSRSINYPIENYQITKC